MKKGFFAMAAALLAVSLTGCAFGAEVFKIGGTGPLTGGVAIAGNSVMNGAQIAVDEINAADGPFKIEFRYEDDVCDPEKAVNAYNVLKDWGMQLFLSSVTSTACVATTTESFADRIFSLTPTASSTAVTEDKDNSFQMCFIDPNQGVASAQYIASRKIASKIAVIWKNDDVYSTGIHSAFVAKAAELGLSVVSDTTFADGNDTDFSVQLSEAHEAGAELVFMPIYFQPISLILTEAAVMGYAPKWFGVDGMDGLLSLTGFNTALAEGAMLLTPFAADAADDLTVKFVAEYRERFGEIPNQFAADGYDCVRAYAQALAKGGAKASMSAEELCGIMMKEFTSMTFNGVTGVNVTWNAEGQVSKDPKAVVIKNGVYVGLD